MVVIFKGDVVGCLWSEYKHGDFGFDIAVLPEYQGKGIGTELAKIALDEYKDLPSELNISICVEVVNPRMGRILNKYGLAPVNNQTNNYYGMPDVRICDACKERTLESGVMGSKDVKEGISS